MKSISILLLIVFLTVQCVAQKIIENKVDEFTGSTVITTSNLSLFVKGLGRESASYRLQNIDGTTIMRMLYGQDEAFSVLEGSRIVFLFETGETFTMHSMDYRISEPNSTSSTLLPDWSARVSYKSLDDPKLKALEKTTVSKIRIYFTDGYKDYEIKPKIASVLQKAVKLINETLARREE